MRHANNTDDAHAAHCRQTKRAELACLRCHLQTTEEEHKGQLYLPYIANLKGPKLRHWQTNNCDVGRDIKRSAQDENVVKIDTAAWDLWIPQSSNWDTLENRAYDLDNRIGDYETTYSPCETKKAFSWEDTMKHEEPR